MNRARRTSPDRPRNRLKRLRGGVRFPVLVLIAFSFALGAWQLAQSWGDAPSRGERIYAKLVEWGVDAQGLVPPVDQAEIDRRVEELWSDDGEVRVRAARWLAARGIRDTGGQIAASMTDPGTLRPCQLAHSLGKLGDDQWVDALLVAAKQPSNTDLRTCAAIALSDIASPRAVDALTELTREDPSRTFGVRALGEAGDPRALGHLRWLRGRAASAGQRQTIELAIERVELLSRPDPVPGLLGRLERSVSGARIDEWALRHLARRGDQRCVAPLSRMFADPGNSTRTREMLAAALLAHQSEGFDALAYAADTAGAETRGIASIALRVSANERRTR